jgi:hypothetical protein
MVASCRLKLVKQSQLTPTEPSLIRFCGRLSGFQLWKTACCSSWQGLSDGLSHPGDLKTFYSGCSDFRRVFGFGFTRRIMVLARPPHWQPQVSRLRRHGMLVRFCTGASRCWANLLTEASGPGPSNRIPSGRGLRSRLQLARTPSTPHQQSDPERPGTRECGPRFCGTKRLASAGPE